MTKVIAEHGGDALKLCRKIGFPRDFILDFSLNVNPYGPPESVINVLRSCVSDVKFYPERSYSKLRESIAAYIGVDGNEIIVGCGATELIHSILTRFVKKGPVVIPLPTFSEYEAAARALNLKIKFVTPLGLDLDIEKINDMVRKKSARCVMLCNPNNPTGQFIERNKLIQLVELAKDNDVIIIVDEAYLELSEMDYTLATLINDYHNLFVLRSLTKPFGFPGLRVGYAVCDSKAASRFESTAISWRVGVLEEAAALAALENRNFLESTKRKILEEKKTLFDAISRIPSLQPITSSTNFFMIDISATGMSPSNLKWRFLSYGVIIRDLTSVKGLHPNSFVRVCTRRSEENRILLEALKNILFSIDKFYPNNPECIEKTCHNKIEDCRFCFCPFYPCLDTHTGGTFTPRESGGIVWNCSNCEWIHRSDVVNFVLKELSSVDVKSADPEKILSIRRRALNKCSI